ncbi:MAG: cyclic nucleotide-binding domain-containing protein [Thermodesulfobacteriota bacterium]
MITLDFLENVTAFKELTDEQLTAIANTAELAEFKKDEQIFAQGADAENLWIVADGDVELRAEQSGPEAGGLGKMAFLSSAQAFGWTCFVPPYQYQLSGYCASRQCRMIRLARNELDRLFEDHPEIGFAVMQYTLCAVGTQFQELEDELAKKRGHEIMSNW